MNLKYVDTHTMGEPTRIIVGGIPHIEGKTMMEKKGYLEVKLDHIRTMAIHEPRGHKNMFGAIITKPVHKEADMGVIFMDGGGYLNMCCHGSMGVATFLVEGGYVEIKEPTTYITLDTPAGLIKAMVKVKNRKAIGVSITNVPSFLYKRDIEIDLSNIGKVLVDISFGGNFFALVKGEDIGVDLSIENIDKLVKHGLAIRDILNKETVVVHPTDPLMNKVDLVEIYGKSSSQDTNLKNVVIFGDGQVDRSPCGTGTSAKLAALYSKGLLKIKEPFVYESIIGTKFMGKVIEETKVGNYNAIIPEIMGRSFITGYGHLVVDEEDLFKHGFVV